MSAWSIISTLTSPTGGVYTFTGLTLSTYKTLRIEISGLTVTTDGTDPRFTFYVSAAEVVTGYAWMNKSISSSGTSNADSAAGAAAILLVSNDANWDVGNASTKSFSATITVDDPGGTTLQKRAQIKTAATGPTGNVINAAGAGLMTNTGAIDGFKLSGTSSLVAGQVVLLGFA